MNAEIHSINKVNSSPRIDTTINSAARRIAVVERGGACFSIASISPSTPFTRCRFLDTKATTTTTPFPPLLRNYHWLLQLPRQTRAGCTFLSFLRTFPTFLSLSCEILLVVSFRPCRGNFLPICCGSTSPCKSIRGIYSLEIVREDVEN